MRRVTLSATVDQRLEHAGMFTKTKWASGDVKLHYLSSVGEERSQLQEGALVNVNHVEPALVDYLVCSYSGVDIFEPCKVV